MYLVPFVAIVLIMAVVAFIVFPRARRLQLVGESREAKGKRLNELAFGYGAASVIAAGIGAFFSYWLYFSEQINSEMLTPNGQSAMESSFKQHSAVLGFIGPAFITTGRHSGGQTLVVRANLFRAINDFDHALANYYGLMGRSIPKSRQAVQRIAADNRLPEVDCVANAFAGAGKIYALTHKPVEAECAFKRAIQLYGKLNERELVAVTENNLAMVYYTLGQNSDARLLTRKAIEDLPVSCRNDKNSIYLQLISNDKLLSPKSTGATATNDDSAELKKNAR